MDSTSRQTIADKAARRFVANMESMSKAAREQYLAKMINFLADDMQMVALDFSIEMTPAPPAPDKDILL